MNVAIVLKEQVAAMIRDNSQLCLKILWERFDTRSLSAVSVLVVLPDIDLAEILMLSNHCYTAFLCSLNR